jgi:hypothetical protein
VAPGAVVGMTDPWRCPSCGCLAVRWSRAHSPKCNYGTTRADVIDSLEAIGRQLDAWADTYRLDHQ